MDEPIKNYYDDVEKSKKRRLLKLDRWHYIQYLKLQEEIKNKSKKELGMMLSEGYKGAFWNAIYNEYTNRRGV
jgi:hypothetical protein